MSFLRSKSEQLAEYLRDHIRRGELAEPLPGTRLWSERLGVSRRTLKAAIQQLRRDGLLIIGRRGIRLNPNTILPHASAEGTRFVRFLVYGLGSPQMHQHLELLDVLHERLQVHNIQVTTEKCIPPRLREIAQERSGQNELLILASLSPLYQRLFARSGRAALIMGQPARGVLLPSVTADQRGIIHHATQHLLRRGFERVNLVFADVAAPGTSQAISAFRDACNQWPRQPIVGQLVPTKLDDQSLATTVRQFVTRVKGRHGVVVVAPVPVGLIMTALLQRGLAVPREAEIIAVFHSRHEVRLDPPLTRYPFPADRIAKAITEAAVHYFDTRHNPVFHKVIGTEIELPG